MDREAIALFLDDDSRRGAPLAGGFDGAAGGAACGDLVRVSLAIDAGAIRRVSFDAEGCATVRAAAAAVAELADGATLLGAARIGADEVAALLGGVSRQGRHAVELAADALHRALTAAISTQGRPGAEARGLAGQPAPRERVLVALSGGVDSAVAALLERERGAEVIAVTLKLWADARTDGERSCCSPAAVLGARAMAHRLGLAHLTLDLEPRFRAQVVGRFVDGYRVGRTPNPCVLCNGELRIDAMVELADRLGATCLVTGHYARVIDDGEGPLLAAGVDPAKDQSYMLCGLQTATLARMRFPLAELRKPAVRALARDAGLEVADRAESQDLCFLAGEGKRAFLARVGGLADSPGRIVDLDGRTVGVHRGHHHFTVGQRRGLGLAGPEPSYVLATDAESNTVVAGPRAELATTRVEVRSATLHRPGGRVDRVLLRYHSTPIACTIDDVAAGEHARLRLELAEPAYGVAPGQTACLLSGEKVVGRATIEAGAQPGAA